MYLEYGKVYSCIIYLYILIIRLHPLQFKNKNKLKIIVF